MYECMYEFLLILSPITNNLLISIYFIMNSYRSITVIFMNALKKKIIVGKSCHHWIYEITKYSYARMPARARAQWHESIHFIGR
jgi:hypothetical protein